METRPTQPRPTGRPDTHQLAVPPEDHVEEADGFHKISTKPLPRTRVLDCVSLDAKGWDSLNEVKPDDLQISILELTNGSLRELEIKQVRALMRRLPRLDTLVLSKLMQTSDKLAQLADMVIEESKLASLHIRSHFSLFKRAADSDNLNWITKILRKKRGLIELNFMHIPLTPKQHDKIAAAALKSRLIILRLHGCQIDSDEAVRGYSECLKKNNSLTHLDLSSNDLGRSGFALVMEGLLKNTTLSHLSIAKCEIYDGSLGSFFEGLKNNNKLRVLNLSANSQLGDASLAALGVTLKGNVALQQLDLSGTGAQHATVRSLAEALACNTTLHSLRLPYVNRDSLASLAEALRSNFTLRHLEFGYSMQNQRPVDLIKASIARNRRKESERMLAFGIGALQFLHDHSLMDLANKAFLPVEAAGQIAHGMDPLSLVALAQVNHDALQRAQAAQAAYDRQFAKRHAS